jgi:uncharacterized protein (UPF0332 family)
MIDGNAADLSEHRLNKANALLIQAELLLKNHQFDGSINRSYYAIFNAIRSLLALVRLDNRRHSGVISYFDGYFVKTGIFGRQFSKIVHTAFDARQDNDYEDFYLPSEIDAKEQFEYAREFVKEIEQKKELFIQGKIILPKVE